MTGNAAHWFVDRHIAEGRGAKTAFEEAWEGGRQLTYGALAEGAGQVADALTRSGISREARAAMFVLDQIEFPQIFWGALKAGVVPVALNTLLSTDVYGAILRDSRAAIAFVSQSFGMWLRLRASSRTAHIVVIGPRPRREPSIGRRLWPEPRPQRRWSARQMKSHFGSIRPVQRVRRRACGMCIPHCAKPVTHSPGRFWIFRRLTRCFPLPNCFLPMGWAMACHFPCRLGPPACCLMAGRHQTL